MSSSSNNTETLYAPEREEESPPRPSAAFRNGSVLLDKYRIERTIAEGGIGIVLLATHVALEQHVAIKYLKSSALDNPSLVDRFVREARLAAQIRSDHVVRVHDVGLLPSGAPFMVMEYLTGYDLSAVIHAGPSPIARAVDYILQACDALAEAHSLQIVHRDIKPGNLFIAQRTLNNPVLKIIDFGISKVTPRQTEAGIWARRTEDGDRFGTPLYMSPEQLRSTSNVDARTDIWALGVVLHELLTGALPFEGDGLPQLCTSVLSDAPIRLTAARPGAPLELEAIILKCLEKDRLNRFRNVAELAQELVPFGPPDAATRANRIGSVVRSGGASIRPPTPMPGTLRVQPHPIVLTPLAAANSLDARTAVLARLASRSRRTIVGVALALALCATALAALFVVRWIMGDSGEARHAAQAGAVPSASPLYAPETVASRESGSPATPHLAALSSPSATPVVAPARADRPRPVVAQKVPGTAATPPATSQRSAPKASGRALFGERE